MNDDQFLRDENEEIIYVSKEELKRDMAELKALGEELIDMPLGKLAQIPMNQEIADAVALGRKIRNKKDAYRRHLQYLARIMNTFNLDPIHQALERIKQMPLLVNAHAQKLEGLRDTLMNEGDSAIQPLLEEHANMDRSRLRQLIRQAKKHTDDSKPNKAAKQLFQYLKDHIPVA